MELGLSFGGRVTDAVGKPIEGAMVNYLKEGRYSSDSPTTTTDSDGRYRFTSGEAGEGLIQSVDKRPCAGHADGDGFEGHGGDRTFGSAAGRELQVRVVGPDQEPLDDAYVAFWNWDDQDAGSIPGSRGKTDCARNLELGSCARGRVAVCGVAERLSLRARRGADSRRRQIQ